MKTLLLLLLAAAALAGDAQPTRAEREARALAAVAALPDGDKREAGLKVVRAAWAAFRDDCAAAAQPLPEGVEDARKARLEDLARRNAALASLRQLAAGDGGAAITGMLEDHLARWPLDVEAHLLLGRLRLDAGDRDAALRELVTAITLDPDGEAARELRGRLALAQLPEAAEGERAALRERAAADLAPLLARLIGAGIAAEGAGDAAAAAKALAGLEALAPAIAGDAAQARLAALRGAARERADDAAQALPLWEQAAAAGVREPDPAPHLRALIRRLEADRIGPAIAAGDSAALRRLSPSFPEDDALQNRLFRALLTQGRLGDALVAARALLAADPAHPLGLLMADGCAAGVDPKRIELLPPFFLRLRAALPGLGGRFVVLHGLNAALTEAAGDPAGAAAALDPLLAALPDDRAARWQRARLRLSAHDFAGAAADCETLLAAKPDDAEVIGLRGRIRAAAGDRAGALADADRIVALRPGCAALIARARVRRGLDDKAGILADVAAIAAAATAAADVDPLLEAADLARELGDGKAQRAALEAASRLGSAEATLRLKRLR